MSKKMKYLLAHPSYGRPLQAADYAQRWISKASGHDMVYCLSVEVHEADAYREAFRNITMASGVEFHLVSGKFGTCVAAANAAVKQYFHMRDEKSVDMIVLVSDDMDCPAGWPGLLEAGLSGNSQIDPQVFPFTVQVSDGAVDHILTLPIMSVAAYRKLGYIYHPHYISMYADNDLRETSDRHMRTLECRGIIFAHNHWVHGKGPKDSTYAHQDNDGTQRAGARVFETRRAKGFPLDDFDREIGYEVVDHSVYNITYQHDTEAATQIYAWGGSDSIIIPAG